VAFAVRINQNAEGREEETAQVRASANSFARLKSALKLRVSVFDELLPVKAESAVAARRLSQ
jgi:hypothetical protein